MHSFLFVSICSSLAPLVCFFIYRKQQPRQNSILVVSVCLSFVFDVVGEILAKVYHTNTLSGNLYFIISFPTIMWFYHETVTKRSLKIVIRIFTLVFLISAAIFGFAQGFDVFNSNTFMLSSILITITSFFFVVDLNTMELSNFAKSPFHEANILLNTSLALYYFVTILLFALWDHIHSSFPVNEILNFYTFHNALHILKNIGITVAFYRIAQLQPTTMNSYASKSMRAKEPFKL